MKRTLVLGFTLGFATSAFAQANALIKNDDDAAVRAAAITRQYELTVIKTGCLYFDTSVEGKSYIVRVREKHNSACGGDPETSPSVFFLKLRKHDGHATISIDNDKYTELKGVR